MSLRDWRQAIRTPPAYRVGNSTLRIQTQFITVIAVIGLIALIILYGVSSYGGGSRTRFTNDLKLHNEEYDHQHVISMSQPRPSPIQNQDNNINTHYYNSTYPLTKPVKSKMGIKYRIGIISDLDTASKKEKEDIWVSYYHRGYLLWNPVTRKVSVTWDPGPVELSSQMAQGGRAMELSELVTFDGRLLTLDDRTGVIYEIVEHANPRVVPWVLLPDGDGRVSKGFKSEWATVCHQQLYVGGLGKEWTTSKGELVNLNPMFVKRVSTSGAVEHLNWKENYIALRRLLDIEFPGYVIHEAVGWSNVHKRWFFLPRRACKERYDEVSYVGDVVPTHGFSSFKFIPDTGDEIIVALKSSEEAGKTATFITVFSIQGQVLMPETKVADLKYEGIEFI
ncbi:UNVERIFIED_CONTAM: hypothetical protein B566_EDAN016670 [Ephemera danica]|nr:hypothetical protein B566_EDAN016670 [Ephemera danica]